MATIFKGSSEHSIVDIIFKGTSYATLYIKNKIFQLGQFVYNLVYYGTATPLSQARYGPNGLSTNEYALFIGGIDRSSGSYEYFSNIDLYDKNLTNFVSKLNLPQSFTIVNTFTDKKKIVIKNSAHIFVYDINLTNYSDFHLSGVFSNYGYVIKDDFIITAGGIKQSQSTYTGQTVVEAFDYNGSKIVLPKLIKGRGFITGADFNDYTLFVGGQNRTSATTKYEIYTDAYDKEFTKITIQSLNKESNGFQYIKIENCIIFFTSWTNPGYISAYDKELTKVTVPSLSLKRYSGSCFSANKYGLYMGGGDSSVVDKYDDNYTRITIEPLSIPRNASGTAIIGNYIFCAGGALSNNVGIDTVDLYKIEKIAI